jgi:hypothetical protein
MKVCTKCKKEKEIKNFRFIKKRENYTSWCIECLREYCREYGKNDYKLNKQKYIDRQKRYFQKDPEHFRKIRKDSYRRRRMEALIKYGGDIPCCACCGDSHYEFLTIDHINNDGASHRKSLKDPNRIVYWLKINNYPSGFQVLCHNCNLAKSIYKTCPHKNEII